MDSNRIKGKIKQAEGKLIDAKGDLTHSVTDDIKGKIMQVEGMAQEKLGEAKDAIRRALNEKP